MEPTGNGPAPAEANGAPPGKHIDGTSYIKKIFQVSFGLPRIRTEDLEEFVEKLTDDAELPQAQIDNFTNHVRKHLPYLAGDSPVNPREVKRLLNTYTIQLKMLSARGIDLNPDVVLALQTIGFRRDWAQVYERLTTEPDLVIQELQAADAAGATVRIPGEVLDYLQEAAPGFMTASLEPYITSARSIGESDIGLLEAQRQVAQMLRRLDDLQPGEVVQIASEFGGGVSRLSEELDRRSERAVARVALTQTRELESSMKRISPNITEEDLEVWSSRARELLNEIDDALRVLRRQTSVRALA